MIIFFFILVNFRKFGITLVVMASMSLCLFGAVVGLRIADFTIGLTSVLGFITLLGMIVRNVILMYQHAEDKRKVCTGRHAWRPTTPASGAWCRSSSRPRPRP